MRSEPWSRERSQASGLPRWLWTCCSLTRKGAGCILEVYCLFKWWADIMSHRRLESKRQRLLGGVAKVTLQEGEKPSLGCRRPAGKGLEHLTGEYQDASRTRPASVSTASCPVWVCVLRHVPPRSAAPRLRAALVRNTGSGLVHFVLELYFRGGWISPPARKAWGVGWGGNGLG